MRGEHNHDISAGKSEVQKVIKLLKDLRERFTPNVAFASAILPVRNYLATQLALPTKDKLIRTAEHTRKQLDFIIPLIPVLQNFENQEKFIIFIRYDSGSNDHERFILCGNPEKLRVIFLVSRWHF